MDITTLVFCSVLFITALISYHYTHSTYVLYVGVAGVGAGEVEDYVDGVKSKFEKPLFSRVYFVPMRDTYGCKLERL